jgi:hypothetical protein
MIQPHPFMTLGYTASVETGPPPTRDVRPYD